MPKFTAAYSHNGRHFDAEIHAADWAEAERKLAALKSTGRIDGEVVAEYPAGPIALPFSSLWVRVKLWWLGL